jgi:hypothetical protein
MKLKNKIYTLLSVFTLVGLTHSLTLKELNASLTPPTTYNINYSWDSSSLRQELGLSTIGGPAPVYTRSADGSFFNYTTTINNTTHSTILPLGLEITMTFNRSNTNWTSVTGGFVPTENRIGSDGLVGTILNKVYLRFNNQTSKNYILFIDLTSTNSTTYWYDLSYDSQLYLYYETQNRAFSQNTMLSFPLFAFSNLEFITRSDSAIRYFDAWYLRDLGTSSSYTNGFNDGEQIGYDDGYSDGLNNNPNILLNGFQAMVGILVNFMLMILNLEVFNVSIMSVFGILALFVGVIWILKIVRG